MDIKTLMIDSRFGKKTFSLLLIFLVFLGSSLFIAACSDPTVTTPVVVTEVVSRQGEAIIVTRVVRQTIEIPVTPVMSLPEKPVTLDISYTGNYSQLDPQVDVDEIAVDMMENILVGLTRFNLETNTIEPELATDWDVTSGGRRWTFNLRDDIYWVRQVPDTRNPFEGDDGEFEPVRQVTAQDVAYAIERACDPRIDTPDYFVLFIIEGCESLGRLEQITETDLERVGVRAIDNHTLEVRLKEPASHFLSLTSTWLMRPVPAELVEEMDQDWSLPQNIWSSGPFVISSETVMDSRTVLKHNPFWPVPFKGNVDQVNILHLSAADAYALWEERLLDVSPVPAEDQAAIISRHEAKTVLVSNQAVFYLAYNFGSPIFGVPEVRQAFSWSIDRERLVEEVHNQRGLPMRHFGPPGVIGAPPIDEVGTGYSPDLARQKMSQTVFGDCRLLGEITYMVSSTDLALQQAETLRDMWVEELDCREDQFNIVQVQFGQLLASTRPDAAEDRPDIWDLGWASYYPDENNWVGDVLHCTISDNRQNRPCSEVDDLILNANANQSIEDRWQLYRQIEGAFFGPEAIEPISPLYVRANFALVQGWVEFTPAHFGGQQYDTFLVDPDLKDLERTR